MSVNKLGLLLHIEFTPILLQVLMMLYLHTFLHNTLVPEQSNQLNILLEYTAPALKMPCLL